MNATILFWAAKDAYERLPATDPPTTGGKRDALVSIVFSAASIEAFFNELPELLSEIPERLKEESSRVITFARLAVEIEANKDSLKLKYVLAYSILSGQPCDKGDSPIRVSHCSSTRKTA